METASIKPRNDFDFPLNPPHTKNFLIAAAAAANGIHNNHHHSNETIATRYQLSDIEMVALQAYTSLKDLLPTSPSSIMSPTTNRMDSWREIPIKDPLVQHAAWAYLQPMAATRDADDRSLLERLKEKCCGVFGCFNEVLLIIVKRWFYERKGRRIDANENGEEKVH